jgi:hypothetical protein
MARPGLGSLLLLGAAAFGAYKYSKMSQQQKQDLLNRGKKLVNDNLGGLKNSFGGRNTNNRTDNTGRADNTFSQSPNTMGV